MIQKIWALADTLWQITRLPLLVKMRFIIPHPHLCEDIFLADPNRCMNCVSMPELESQQNMDYLKDVCAVSAVPMVAPLSTTDVDFCTIPK